ncbi:hypothetical protein OH492_26765 [Vibrio chagasii]|nr:hypothetical protein [Vibrio chagasii]
MHRIILGRHDNRGATDGDSFVLGGLMSSADLEKMQKILCGRYSSSCAAFRKATTERNSTELIIVAHCKPSGADEAERYSTAIYQENIDVGAVIEHQMGW